MLFHRVKWVPSLWITDCRGIKQIGDVISEKVLFAEQTVSSYISYVHTYKHAKAFFVYIVIHWATKIISLEADERRTTSDQSDQGLRYLFRNKVPFSKWSLIYREEADSYLGRFGTGLQAEVMWTSASSSETHGCPSPVSCDASRPSSLFDLFSRHLNRVLLERK